MQSLLYLEKTKKKRSKEVYFCEERKPMSRFRTDIKVADVFTMPRYGAPSFFLDTRGKVYVYIYGKYSDWSGLGKKMEAKIPTHVPLLENVKEVSCGNEHTAFLTRKGNVYMCGHGDTGALGFGSFRNRYIPTRLQMEKTRHVICGHGYTMFLGYSSWKSGTHMADVFSCGTGSKGQLGLGSCLTLTNTPKEVESDSFGESPLENIVCSYSRTFFLNKQGKVFMCGDSGSYLGENQNFYVPVPFAVEGGPVRSIFCDVSYTVFLTGDKVIGCQHEMSGINILGAYNYNIPRIGEIIFPERIVSFSCGYYIGLFTSSSGKVYMRGNVGMYNDDDTLTLPLDNVKKTAVFGSSSAFFLRIKP